VFGISDKVQKCVGTKHETRMTSRGYLVLFWRTAGWWQVFRIRMQIGFIMMEAGRTPENTHDSMYCLLISFLLSILPSGCCFPAEKGLQCPCTHG